MSETEQVDALLADIGWLNGSEDEYEFYESDCSNPPYVTLYGRHIDSDQEVEATFKLVEFDTI